MIFVRLGPGRHRGSEEAGVLGASSASRELRQLVPGPLRTSSSPSSHSAKFRPDPNHKETSVFHTSGGTGHVDVVVNDFFANTNADRQYLSPTVPRLLVGICAVEAGKEQRDAGVLHRRCVLVAFVIDSCAQSLIDLPQVASRQERSAVRAWAEAPVLNRSAASSRRSVESSRRLRTTSSHSSRSSAGISS